MPQRSGKPVTARIHEIDWENVASSPIDKAHKPIPDLQTLKTYDAVILRIHTPRDFISAMKHVYDWRHPKHEAPYDNLLIVVYDDKLTPHKYGDYQYGLQDDRSKKDDRQFDDITSPSQREKLFKELHDAYLTFISKKNVDGNFPASTFYKGVLNSKDDAGDMIDRILSTNNPNINKPNGFAERFGKGDYIITR